VTDGTHLESILLLGLREEWPEPHGRLGNKIDQAGVMSRHFDDFDAVVEFDPSDGFRLSFSRR
jgi:hypothetical protein